MKRFARLYTELDTTNSTTAKRQALERYFREAPAGDAAWAVFFLTGNKLRRAVPSRRLYELAAGLARLPDWLMDECYEAVGDLAETVALVLPPPAETSSASLSQWVESRLAPIAAAADDAERAQRLHAAWMELGGAERLVWNKLITGEFRVGVSARSVVRALAAVSGLDPAVIAHRLAGTWRPTPENFAALVSPLVADVASAAPYPLFLAHALEGDPETLGSPELWQIEWKWDGIRAQLIRRDDSVALWSRGDERIDDTFPELVSAGQALPPGTVLDGEILVWRDDRPAPFAALQKRLGRRSPGNTILEQAPALFIAYDLLESDGEDIRTLPLVERRSRLEALLARYASARIRLSPLVEAAQWQALREQRALSRERGVEGLMLKRRDAAYGVGRVRGPWWKWKIEPYGVDAVIIAAQRGHGRRASLYTDYTFGVWHEGALVPFAKAYSGLSDAEIREVDRFVREHTRERFGPVRVVEPSIVCEIAFEAIQASNRHKSGIAVRFPRIARLRRDKRPEDADSLETVRALIGAAQ